MTYRLAHCESDLPSNFHEEPDKSMISIYTLYSVYNSRLFSLLRNTDDQSFTKYCDHSPC